MLILETIIGFILEQTLGQVTQQEAVQRVLKRAKLPLEPTPDFESIYTHTLIAYGIGRPPDLLHLFRHEVVRNAYRTTFEQRDPQIFHQEIDAFLQSAEGQALYRLDYDPRRELDIFHARFLDLADRVRTVPEIRQDQQLSDIQDTSRKILLTLTEPHEPPPQSYLPMPPRPVDADTLETAQIKRSTIPRDQVPAIAPLEPNSVMPFHHNRAFVGRQDDLLYVAQHLRDSTTPGAALALTGMGGMGKTQLASEIVHRYGPFFAGGVFWLSCADLDIVPGEIAACGARGLVDWRSDYLNLSQEEQIPLVLSAWQSPLPRLLIFDNCEDPALLNQWRPTTGGCTVLVTSRRATWPATMGITVYPLAVLQRSESSTLLRHFRPDIAVDNPDLEALARELGDLPLALHLAGSYLAVMRHAVTPAIYLAEVQASDLLDHPSLQASESDTTDSPTQHTQHVARTFALSYRQLDATSPRDHLAQQTLACAAAGAPGEILPRAVLYATLEQDDDAPPRYEQEAVLQRLINLGLLEAIGNGGLRLHRLLAAFVQEQDTDGTATEQLIRACVTVAAQYQEEGYPVRIIALHGHLRHLTHQLLQTPTMDVVHADLCHNVAYYLDKISDYSAARPLLERALDIYEHALGPHHPDTATNLNNLAALLLHQGDYAAARPLYEQALTITEQVLGSNHSDTARSLNNLAHLLDLQGDYAAAQPLYERALDIYEHALGPHHPDTATSLNSLARLLHHQGDYAAAQPLYEQALAIYEHTLGLHHPDTATSLNNLAGLLKSQGDYAAAQPLYEQALAIREHTLGLHHPDTATSLNNLATLLLDQGDYAAAQPLCEQALTITEQVLGPNHPNTARSLNNLAGLLHCKGDYAAAQPLCEQALTITEQVLGPNHPDTATSLNNLARILHDQGDYAAARPLYERALAIYEQALGPDHPRTATSFNNLAGLLCSQEDYAAARPLYERALAIYEQALGPDHPHTAQILNNLAFLLGNQGDYAAAQPLYERALTIREQTLGPDHLNTAQILNNLAFLLGNQGDYAAAQPLYERALAIHEQALGPTHPTTAIIRNNLAACLDALNERPPNHNS